MAPRPPAVRPRLRAGDDGFTILEMSVAIALVTIVMASLAVFFVNSARATNNESLRQTAVQAARDAMESSRALTGIGVLHNRDKTSSDALWLKGQDGTATSQFPGVSAYLTNVTEAYDTTTGLAANAGYTAPLPTDGNIDTIDGTAFTQNWFLGWCYSSPLVNSGACQGTAAAGLTTYLQIVVAVTWTNNACKVVCSYTTVTRVSPTPDPVFDITKSAPKPKITNPGNQVTGLGRSVVLPVTLTGGTAPITWTSANLPPGLIMTPAASVTTISGIPTTLGTYNVVLTVTDAFGFTSNAAFTWTITAPPALTNPGKQYTVVNTADSLALAVTGGTGTLTYTITGQPNGLTINSSTGVISGTPTSVSALPIGSTVTVTVTDSTGLSDTETFQWVIVKAISVTPSGTQTSEVGVTDTVQMAAANGAGSPYTWSATGLPAGMTIDASGKITGKPTATCSCSTKVTATDGSGISGTASFTWTVYAAVNITAPTTAQSGKVGTTMQAVTATASGGDANFTWSATNLPPGLSINPGTGAISGKPTNGQRYLTTITVIDGQGGTDSQTVVWTVTNGFTFTGLGDRSDPSGTTLTTITPTVTGGTYGTYAWSASGLPDGVSINASNGKLTGKPTTPGTYTVTITAQSYFLLLSGGTGTYMFTWTIT